MAESKLDRLRHQIESAAENDAKRITAAAEKEAAAIIAEEKERIEKEQNSSVLAKMSRFENDERKRVSESKYAADRKVLLHRNSLVDALFEDVKTELSVIAGSVGYIKLLSAAAENADRTEKLGDTVTAYCRRADKDTAEGILKKYGVKVETDRNIRLGGLLFKYPEKGIFIDLTFDSAFEEQREEFAARAEMQL